MNALDTSMIAYRAKGSTVLVKTENETVNGFFVREGLVATSSRILEDGADRIYLQRSTDDPRLFHVDGAAFQDSESGIAVLRVSSLEERVLPLSSASVQAGERVYVVENIEKDSRTVWREATVSGFQTDTDMPRILFNGSVPGGAVGSAVLNDQSEAVGVIVDVPTGGGTFAAMPSAQLKEAVAQIKHDGSRRIDPIQATIRFGKGPVRCLVFSPDGRTLAVGSSFAVWLYDVETGAQLNRFRAWEVQALAFSSDGKTLAAAEEMGQVFLWDVETGQSPILTSQRPWHNYDAKALAFSPDGRILMSGSCDDVALWNLQTGELIARFHRLEVRTSYNAHAFSPDGQTVASSCDDTVRIWNPETQEGEITLKGHTDRVQAMSYSADGRTLITGGDDKTIRIWSAETVECVQTLENASEYVRSISCSRVRNMFVSDGWGGDLLIRDIETGEIQRRIEAHTENIDCAAISPDGKTVASAGRDAEIRFWNVETGEAQTVVKGHTRGGSSPAFSPDGTTLAVAADNKIWLWDAQTGVERAVLKECAGATAFSPDGTTFASCGEEGAVRLWDAQTGKLEAEMKGHTDAARLLAFSPDGKTAVSAGEDKTVRVWDVQAKTGRTVFTADNGVVFKALLQDGKTVAGVCKENGLQVWNVETRELQATLDLDAETVYAVAFSPDGRTLASGGKDLVIRLWDLQTGERKAEMTGHRNSIGSIAFSPNGAILTTVDMGSEVRLWDVQKEWHIMAIDSGLGYTGYTAYPVFSADGTKLAIAGDAGSALLWDIASLLPADAPRPA